VARRAKPDDAGIYADRWAAIKDSVARWWPGPLLTMDAAYFRALLTSPGYVGYVSDDSRAVLLIRPSDRGVIMTEELFLWATVPGLPVADYRALLKDLFATWFLDARDHRGDPLCAGELPPAAPAVSQGWLNSFLPAPTTVLHDGLTLRRWQISAGLALERLS